MSLSGEILFGVTGLIALLSAVLTVTQRSPLRAAVALLVHVISLAGLYLTLHAHLLAAIQMLVYAGAVVVLFVFVIMLLGPGGIESRGESRGTFVKVLGGAMIMIVAGVIAFQAGDAVGTFEGIPACPDNAAECHQFGGVDALAEAIYVGSAIPFELVSILLLIAIVGAVAVARGENDTGKLPKDPELLNPRPRTADALPPQAGEEPAK